mmetsp:Transcript_3728/g.7124  ORF Transcript_3728/g.7124 Transcript_3728/m.7124 type:complete len:82 (+) Transcript_3728:761-1006(+)
MYPFEVHTWFEAVAKRVDLASHQYFLILWITVEEGRSVALLQTFKIRATPLIVRIHSRSLKPRIASIHLIKLQIWLTMSIS